jgi:hypothetical protein
MSFHWKDFARQGLELRSIRRLLAEPCRPGRRFEDHQYPVVKVGVKCAWRPPPCTLRRVDKVV